MQCIYIYTHVYVYICTYTHTHIYIYKYLIFAFNYPIPANAESWHWWWHPVCWHHPSPRKHGWVWSQPRASWTTCDCEHLGSSMGSGLRLTFQTKITLSWTEKVNRSILMRINQSPKIRYSKMLKDPQGWTKPKSCRLKTLQWRVESPMRLTLAFGLQGRVFSNEIGIKPCLKGFRQRTWDSTSHIN